MKNSLNQPRKKVFDKTLNKSIYNNLDKVIKKAKIRNQYNQVPTWPRTHGHKLSILDTNIILWLSIDI